MRNFLVTQFVCGVCGERLEVDSAERGPVRSTEGITGAAKVDSVIAIMPCPRCMKPTEEVKRAVNVLLALADEGRSLR